MLPSTLHDYYASGDDPRDTMADPIECYCEDCHVALEIGEEQRCNACDLDFFVCPDCKGRGYDGPCYEHGPGNCNCPRTCGSCDGEGRLLLSNREGLALELAPVPPVKSTRCKCGAAYLKAGETECIGCWGDRQDALEARGE
jgi:hypothetical protein